MITKAIITYSDGSEATFVGEPLNLSEVPLLSSEQQVAPSEALNEAPVEESPVEESPVEAPVEAPAEDETPATEAVPAE